MPQAQKTAGTAARQGALRLLDAVLGDGCQLSSELSGPALARLDPPDRARAQRLALQTLRGLERADRLLAPNLSRTPPLPIQNILRLGVVELAYGAPAYGVVNAMVDIAGRNRRHGRLRGLVNAVLRKQVETQEIWDTLPVPSLPDWLRRPLCAAWGETAVSAMEAAHFRAAPLDITLRPGVDAPDIEDAQQLPTGSLRLPATIGQISALPGYESGDWWVQDAAAALPALMLAPKAGDAVLDMCAAPGGKALQLAAAGAKVTALDISEGRMRTVRENLDRTGLSARLVTGDAFKHRGRYRSILLDAPCSATGTIRRHPDLPHTRNGALDPDLPRLQAAMIDHALSLLEPGGRLVYCTCSLLPEEGEDQARAALARHSGIASVPDAAELPGIETEWLSPEGGLRLRPDYWPERGGMDGFYAIALTKTG